MSARIAFSEIPKGLMSTMMTTEHYINKCDLDLKLLELISLRVSNINQCAYCIDMHFKEAMAVGEDLQRLYSQQLQKLPNNYTAEERACFAWAEFITLPTGQHDEQSLFEELLQFFDRDKIANLTLMIIQINAWNRLMKAFGIEAGNYQVSQQQGSF